MTYWRSAQWPTSEATLTPRLPRMASRYCPKVVKPHFTPAFKAGNVIASTRSKLLQDRVAIGLFARRQRQAAVAGNDRGHAVITRRSRQRVPQQLGIEMGVEVDEARRHRQAVGVDRALGAAADPSGLDDLAVLHRHVAKIRRQPAAVINPSAFDQNIVSH